MIEIEITNKSGVRLPLSFLRMKDIITTVLRKEKKSVANISIVFVGDKKIQSVNKKFLQHNYVTDIITFILEEKILEVEIYINPQQAKRQAKEYDVSFLNEISRLLIHGILHCVGYDDTTEKKKKIMFQQQEKYVEMVH